MDRSPMVWPLAKPRTHKITSITKVVQSIPLSSATKVPIWIVSVIQLYRPLSKCPKEGFLL
jgi:hypothetical protein